MKRIQEARKETWVGKGFRAEVRLVPKRYQPPLGLTRGERKEWKASMVSMEQSSENWWVRIRGKTSGPSGYLHACNIAVRAFAEHLKVDPDEATRRLLALDSPNDILNLLTALSKEIR